MSALLSFAAIAFLFDQLTKRKVQTRRAVPIRARLLSIRAVEHREHIYYSAIFRALMVILWCVATMAAVWLHGSRLFLHTPTAMVGVGCALGGAAGNLVDILRRQYVLDFIDLGWWPVFNLADVAIVCGLILASWA